MRRLCLYTCLSVEGGYSPPLDRYTPTGKYPPGRYTPQGRYTPKAGTPPRSSACWEIWITRRRYASYWNAFLFKFVSLKCIHFQTNQKDFISKKLGYVGYCSVWLCKGMGAISVPSLTAVFDTHVPLKDLSTIPLSRISFSCLISTHHLQGSDIWPNAFLNAPFNMVLKTLKKIS